MWQTYPKQGSVLWVGEIGADHNALRNLALDYAKYLLSENNERSGPLFDTRSHPDFRLLEPEEDKQWIKIDKIRELAEWSLAKPQISSRKVAILNPADAMNLQSANAFLKTLEEPTPTTLFLLVTHQVHLLPATIRSRCHIVRHRTQRDDYQLGPDPIKIQIQSDLEEIQSNQVDPTIIAAKWLKKDIQQILYWLMVVLCEFTNGSAQDMQLVKSKRWWRFMDEVFAARKSVEERMPVNAQLLLESLLIHYSRIMTQ